MVTNPLKREPHGYDQREDPWLEARPCSRRQEERRKGHWHIYVNGMVNTFAATTFGTTKRLKKDDDKVHVTLDTNDHSLLSEPTRSKTITMMVD
jgi:hypothetical protein